MASLVGSDRRRRSSRAAALAFLTMALGTTALGGCDWSGAAPDAEVAIELASDTLAIEQGAIDSVTVTLDRLNGFADSVGVLVEGLPPGVTARSLSFVAGQTTGTLTLAVAHGATTDTSVLSVHVHAAGVDEPLATAPLALVIRPAGPGFSLSFDPPIVGLPRGASRTTTVTITRAGGFTGAVDLAASTLLPGITAQLNPPRVFATTSTLTLTASQTAALGATTATVRGTGTGVRDRSGTATLNVTAGDGGPTGNVSATFCPLTGAPNWVAFQDGGGPWVLSTPTNGAYVGQVSSGRGGLAYVVAGGSGGFELTVRYGTTAELQAFDAVVCHGSTGAGKSVNATVTGTGSTDLVLLGLGTSSAAPSVGDPRVFAAVPDGPIDLVGARGALGAPGIDRLFIRRGITPAAGSTVTVDFGGSDALDPVRGTVTLANLGTDQAVVSGAYRTPDRTFFPYSFDVPGTSTSRTFGGFPASAGSFHLVQAQAAPNLQRPDRMRTASEVHAAVGNLMLTLGADLGPVSIGQAGTSPPLRMEAVIPATTYRDAWSARFSHSTGAEYRSALVHATSGYVGGTPATVTLAVPELSAVAGYNDLWGLAEVSEVDWSALGQTLVGFGPGGRWQEGATLRAGARFGTFKHH